MKQLPNALSCLRIAMSLTLPFITGRPFLFAAVYILCGVTDALDGYLARRLNAQSALGARLDTIGDSAFFGAALFAIGSLLMGETAVLICIVVITAVRVANIIIAKIDQADFELHRISNGSWELEIPLASIHHGDLYALSLYWEGGHGKRIPAWARRVVQD